MNTLPAGAMTLLKKAADAYTDFARQYVEVLTAEHYSSVPDASTGGSPSAPTALKGWQIVSGEDTPRQDWSALRPGDRVSVSESGNPAYEARVDILTGDSSVMWILAGDLKSRKAFDCREDVVIRHSDTSDSLLPG